MKVKKIIIEYEDREPTEIVVREHEKVTIETENITDKVPGEFGNWVKVPTDKRTVIIRIDYL